MADKKITPKARGLARHDGDRKTGGRDPGDQGAQKSDEAKKRAKKGLHDRRNLRARARDRPGPVCVSPGHSPRGRTVRLRLRRVTTTAVDGEARRGDGADPAVRRARPPRRSRASPSGARSAATAGAPTCSTRATSRPTCSSWSTAASRSARSPRAATASSTPRSTGPQFFGELGRARRACRGRRPRSRSRSPTVWRAGGGLHRVPRPRSRTPRRAILRALARQVQSHEAFVEDLLYLDLKGRVAKRLLQLVSPSLDELPDGRRGRARRS